jgi:hypothetical protein
MGDLERQFAGEQRQLETLHEQRAQAGVYRASRIKTGPCRA